jgi:hypothetical protein
MQSLSKLTQQYTNGEMTILLFADHSAHFFITQTANRLAQPMLFPIRTTPAESAPAIAQAPGAPNSPEPELILHGLNSAQITLEPCW